jgi:hypothetical protein
VKESEEGNHASRRHPVPLGHRASDLVVPGTVDDEGRVEFDDAPSARTYGVVDQTVARAFLAGARVLGIRRDDLPGGGSVAAILRYPF